MQLHPHGRFDNQAQDYRHIQACPLAAAMGAEIRGVDVATVTDVQFAEIQHALFRHKMIFFRDQASRTRITPPSVCASVPLLRTPTRRA